MDHNRSAYWVVVIHCVENVRLIRENARDKPTIILHQSSDNDGRDRLSLCKLDRICLNARLTVRPFGKWRRRNIELGYIIIRRLPAWSGRNRRIDACRMLGQVASIGGD